MHMYLTIFPDINSTIIHVLILGASLSIFYHANCTLYLDIKKPAAQQPWLWPDLSSIIDTDVIDGCHNLRDSCESNFFTCANHQLVFVDVIKHRIIPDMGYLSWVFTHLPQVSVNQVSIGSNNGLSPGRCQGIIWTNDGIMLFGPLGINFGEILIHCRNPIRHPASSYHLKDKYMNSIGKTVGIMNYSSSGALNCWCLIRITFWFSILFCIFNIKLTFLTLVWHRTEHRILINHITLSCSLSCVSYNPVL